MKKLLIVAIVVAGMNTCLAQGVPANEPSEKSFDKMLDDLLGKTEIVANDTVAQLKNILTQLNMAAGNHLHDIKGEKDFYYQHANFKFLEFPYSSILTDESRGCHIYNTYRDYQSHGLLKADMKKIHDALAKTALGKATIVEGDEGYIWEQKGKNGCILVMLKKHALNLYFEYWEYHHTFSYALKLKDEEDRERKWQAQRQQQQQSSGSGSTSSSNTDSETAALKQQIQKEKQQNADLESLLGKLKAIDKRFDECEKMTRDIAEASKKKLTGFYVQNQTQKLSGKLIDIKYELKQILREYQYKVPSSSIDKVEALIQQAEDWLDGLESDE